MIRTDASPFGVGVEVPGSGREAVGVEGFRVRWTRDGLCGLGEVELERGSFGGVGVGDGSVHEVGEMSRDEEADAKRSGGSCRPELGVGGEDVVAFGRGDAEASIGGQSIRRVVAAGTDRARTVESMTSVRASSSSLTVRLPISCRGPHQQVINQVAHVAGLFCDHRHHLGLLNGGHRLAARVEDVGEAPDGGEWCA